MSEPEFEMYLSLLSKLLRLNSAQTADIAEELRDHLEERLVQLTAQGKSREEAIRLALDEFGDAGALAWQFARPHSLRRRRQIMRYSIGSFFALAGIFTLVSLTWPARPDLPPAAGTVVAQGESPGPVAGPQPPRGETGESSGASQERQEIEKKLASREFGFDFVEMKLHDALAMLTEQTSLPIIYAIGDPEGFDGEGRVISLRVEQGKLSVRSALELILRQGGNENELTYSIKDGVILISNSSEDYEVQAYDCRDLLAGVQVQQKMAGELPGRTGGMGGGAKPVLAATSAAGAALMNVIQSATQPSPWINSDGEGGSMSEFDGVLIVHHHQAVHRKIEDVLKKLRLVKHGKQLEAQPQAENEPLVIPPGKRLVTLNANNWQVPINAIRTGSRIDVVRFFHGPDHNHEVVLSNAEILLPDLTPLTMGGLNVPTTLQVNSVSLIVTPDEAMNLMNTENITSLPLRFLLRGEDDEEDGDDNSKADAEEETRAAPLLNKLTDTVLAFLPDSLRDRVEVTAELVNLEADRSRFYPLVGPAHLVRGRYRYTIDYSKIAPDERPQPLRDSSEPQWIVYQDVNHLIRDR